MKELYFAYGSNLLLTQMQQRCPSAEVVSRATLLGYKLDFVQPHAGWGGGTAGIVAELGGRVEGVVYQVSEEDLKMLDWYEPTADGRYWRLKVAVMLPSEEVIDVWTYAGERFDGAPFSPSDRYLNTILQGAAEHGLPPDYIAKLKCWQQP